MALSGVKEYQPAVAQLIENIADNGKAANLYIFYGPSRSGRSSYARRLFFQLNQLPQSDKHQDFYHFQVDTRIKREHIIDIQRFVKFGPREAHYLVVLIEDAGSMTTEAANAFLKTLEEPPPGVVFILEVHRLTDLLTTIVSRAQHVRLLPLSQEHIAEQLASRELDPQQLAAISELGLTDLELIDWYLDNQQLFQRLSDLSSIDELDVMLLSEELSKQGKSQIELFLRALSFILHKQQQYQQHKILLKYQKKFKIPVNIKLFIEAMLFEMKGTQ